MKVYLATPAMDGLTRAGYSASLVKAAQNCQANGIEIVPAILPNGAFIEIARSLLVQMFLKTDCTHLFFVDADLSFESHAMSGLVMSGIPFSAGVYRKRQPKVSFNADKFEGEPEMNGPWVKFKRVATGFMCLERRVLEEMTKRAEVCSIGEHGEVPMVFHTVYGDHFVGEDYSFCDDYNKLYEEGVFEQPIWVWPNLTFDHDGFIGNLHESLIENPTEPRVIHRGVR